MLIKRYLFQDNDALLRVLVCRYVEHAGPIAVHDPVVDLCIGADVLVLRFDSGHHRLQWQRLQDCVLIGLWEKEGQEWMLVMDVLISPPARLHNTGRSGDKQGGPIKLPVNASISSIRERDRFPVLLLEESLEQKKQKILETV